MQPFELENEEAPCDQMFFFEEWDLPAADSAEAYLDQLFGTCDCSPNVILPPQERKGSETMGSKLSFREFVMDAQAQGIVELQEEVVANGEVFQTSVGIQRIIVLDVTRWHKHAEKWLKRESGKWIPANFHMRLRRLGFTPLNRAPKPATTGFDFTLKRADVEVHGFAFNPQKWEIYARK